MELPTDNLRSGTCLETVVTTYIVDIHRYFILQEESPTERVETLNNHYGKVGTLSTPKDRERETESVRVDREDIPRHEFREVHRWYSHARKRRSNLVRCRHLCLFSRLRCLLLL